MSATHLFQNILIDPTTAVNPLTRSASRRFISTKRGDDAIFTFLNHIFIEAPKLGAWDIHFRDGASFTTVRFRVGGGLNDQYYIAKEASHDIDIKLRARCKLDPTERLSPLDGKFWFDLGDRMLDVRVSILQSKHGQTTVCRLLDQANAGRNIAEVEMTDDVRQVLMQALRRKEGILLVTGPTGSGKTSTLYACLNHLNDEEIHIVTAEDPVEYDLPGSTQVQVEPPQRSFERILRAFLRQDFDVGLVGEIRDAETSQITMQASNTGHLMLSTLHTNDGPSTITRLLDFGVERFAFGSALLAIVSQRLEEKLCPMCAIEHELTPDEFTRLTKRGYPTDRKFYRANPGGCEHCLPIQIDDQATPIMVKAAPRRPAGEKGRIPIIAIIEGTPELKQAIKYGDQNGFERAIAMQPQYRSLPVTALDLCVAKKLDFHRALGVTES